MPKPEHRNAFSLSRWLFAALGVAFVAAIAGIAINHYGPRGPVWQPAFPDSPELFARQSTGGMGELDRTGGLEPNGNHGSPPPTADDVIREAGKLLEFVVSTFPKLPDALELCTRIRSWLGDSDGAVESQRPDDVVALCDELGGFYTDAGRIFFTQGQLPVAEMLCQRAAILSPNLSECRQALALICRRQGRLAEAIRWLEELGRCVDDPDIYFVEIGRLHLELGEPKEAEAAFRRARRLAPNNEDACTSLARLLLSRNASIDEAIALSEAAIGLQPSAENFALLGNALQSAGDTAGSIDAFQRAVDLAPEVDEYKRALESARQSR